jgi:hypothetical protein
MIQILGTWFRDLLPMEEAGTSASGYIEEHRGAATRENIAGVVKLYPSSCPQSPFRLKSAPPVPRSTAPIALDGSFEFRNVPPGKYAICVAIGAAPYVAGPSVTVTNKDIVNVTLPRMRGSESARTETPSLAGSGPLNLDWPRIEQAAKTERENAANMKRAQK